MSLTRRDFLSKSARTGAGFTIFASLGSYICVPLRADGTMADPDEHMAYYTASKYTPYVSQQSITGPDAVTWIQIDLGKTQAIDAVKLYPAVHMIKPGKDFYSDQNNFPLRFKIEASDDPQFATSTIITDQTGADFPDPHTKITTFSQHGAGSLRPLHGYEIDRLLALARGGGGAGRTVGSGQDGRADRRDQRRGKMRCYHRSDLRQRLG